jgi:hypothetical protein
LIILAVLALIHSSTVLALSIVQLIVLWVHGVVGPNATVNVDGDLKDEPEILPLTPLLEALLVLALKRFSLAIPNLVARIVF